jgi:hypothetical protein
MIAITEAATRRRTGHSKFKIIVVREKNEEFFYIQLGLAF